MRSHLLTQAIHFDREGGFIQNFSTELNGLLDRGEGLNRDGRLNRAFAVNLDTPAV